MDAYDEDSGAPRGPDGPTGARRAGALERDGGAVDGAAAERADGQGADGQGDGRRSGADETGADETGAGEAAGSASASPESAEQRAVGGGDAASGSGSGEGADPVPDLDSAGRLYAPTSPPTTAPSGVAALSPAHRITAAAVLGAVAVVVCVHLAMVFLSLAPANTVSKRHGKAVEAWVYPEFEQNWKLFAPNPLQQNIAVEVRAELATKDGDVRTTGWVDLSAEDGAAIDHNPVPSHTQQNELRRAWDFLVSTHNADSRPVGTRGTLSEEYMRRIVVMRLAREADIESQGVVQRVQVRSKTVNVAPPVWSGERISTQPVYRALPWWTVTAADATGGAR
ncbi:hypothetical protein GTW40_24205 [Streptomyces sp. SID4985]|uniref:DUF5819 family protein n=1 Tax=Streptomyces sp. SID4985 TaxID=2690292 RepID=UPI0013680FFC|nr:DUF5819 family protein [Streptomyces sp. SID4985]MYQ48109.1 hypothetical protein [Streptomyces sp. SID4985]